jgi:hypothetical protein
LSPINDRDGRPIDSQPFSSPAATMSPVSNSRFLIGGLAAWPVMMAIATLDGMARERFMNGWIGAGPALLFSGVVMIVAVYVVAWLMLSWWGRPRSDAWLWLVGAMWVGLTMAFELAMLVLVRGQSPREFLAGYDPMRIADGNLIVPGLLLMLVAPVLLAHIRRG